ncbi:MAG: ATP-binding protein [Alphaproteobacteria bacterium]|nr:MAG: ATP-binding protein [Alphaproteobacteria bacterium]
MHGREGERSALKRKLLNGVSINMPAPRRIGKTWTIGRLAEDLRKDGWVVVEADVEGIKTPDKFARELWKRIEAQSSVAQNFRAHAKQRLSSLLGGGWDDNPLSALGKIDPIEFTETLIASLDSDGKKAAIIIDEISYFFLKLAETDPGQAQAFAYQLRAFQQRYKNVRWLITGSIGLTVIARRYGLEGAFVDLDTFTLEPFTPNEARSFMRDPAIQQQFNHVFDASDTDFDSMFKELGWLAPYYLRMVANEVRPSIAAADGSLARATAADFEAAFEKLLQPGRKSEFAVWREHIDKNLPDPDRKLARTLLNVLSQDASGETETTLVAAAQADGRAAKLQIQEVLEILANDGLIGKTAARYAFRSGLIRRYWKEYEAE